MDLLLRFHGGFGVDSGPDSYGQETIITVPQDVAEKSGRFETDFVVNVKVPLGSMNRFLHPTCDENGNPLGDCHFDGTCDEDGNLIVDWLFVGNPLRGWYFDVDSALAEWAEANYPLNWELGVASDLTDYELAEADHLDELYDARLDELYYAHLADLFEEDQLVENQLAEATWAYPTNSELYEDDHLADMHEEVRLDALDEEASRIAEWSEEIRLANWCKEGYPLRWD